MPRRYRGLDIWRWIDLLGDLDVRIEDVPDERAARRTPSLAVTGAHGGEDLDLNVLQGAGITIAGRLERISGRHACFGDNLPKAVVDADRRMRRLLARIDDLADRLEVGSPAPDPIADVVVAVPPREIELGAAGIRTVLWATGYRREYPWLHVPVLDGDGEVVQRGGVTPVAGLYTLGLKFQRRRRSHFIGGVGADAAFVAGVILRTGRSAGAA
jgi:putative flavoprotein involved in K+ transport